ncbi:mitochondrial ribosomal death-associated protein 3-domain-containing protein [Lophiotrema nucula]|uniref:Small ribosomal subunit protein mS29 n=1 Tax=Lophiotrema nucula TaxID=690887 RepID=A0A6A5YZ72_9PLEO|nr:mitochondrial ribosomal death-associated protein 3-domain-containing protein [Lophiotrema nucula]
MASSTCLRRFSQLSLDRATQPAFAPRSLLAATQASCFSTSAARHANPTGKKGMGAAPKRGTKTLNVKKGRKDTVKDLSKKPSPGDRKAMRKRIVLSNNNALEVPGLKDLEKDNALDPSNEGKVMGLAENVVDALRAVEAFKPSQGWSLFRRPATLMRKETIQVAQLLKEAEEAPEGQAKKTLRRILTGQRMSGKSTLILQGLAMGVLRDWVVIHLPEGQDLVNAHTEYAPLPGSQPTQYTQDLYTANLLSQIIKANEKILASININTNPSLPFPLPANSNLKQLADLGIINPEASWPVFAALWKELTQPGRPPIMLGLDGLSHVMGESQYMSAEVKRIHAFDLTIVRHFIDHLSGKVALPNGGLVLAATTKSNSPTSPALDFSIQVAEARQNKASDLPQWNPYANVDQRAMEALKDIEVLKVGGMSKEEARSIMEYYAASGMLRAKVDEGFVTEKWSLAGMGNIGELERASVRLRV